MSPTEYRKVYMNEEAPPVEGYYNIAPNSPEKLIPSETFESIFFLFLRPLRNSKRRNTRRLGLDSPFSRSRFTDNGARSKKRSALLRVAFRLSPFALGFVRQGARGGWSNIARVGW